MKVFCYIRQRIKTLFHCMSKHIHILTSIAITTLIVTSAVLYSKNQALGNRINTISQSIERMAHEDSTFVKHESYKTQFKEDYYIQQQDYNTTLILTVFGLTIAFFGFLSYNSFLSQVKGIEAKVKKNKRLQEEEHKRHEDKLIELSNDVSYQLGSAILKEAKEKLDLQDQIIHIITGCEHLSKAIANPINENEEYINSTKGIISDHIKELAELIDKNSDNIVYSNLKPERLQSKQDRIRKVIPSEDVHLLNKIFSKIVVS